MEATGASTHAGRLPGASIGWAEGVERLAFDALGVGVAVVSLRARRAVIARANARAEYLLAAGPLEGRSLHEVLPVSGLDTDPDEVLRRLARVAAVVPASGPASWLEITVSPLPVDDGGAFVVQVTDVSEASPRRRALEEAVSRLEGIIDNSAALIYVKDTDGRYTLVNQYFERRFGLTREQVLGRTDHDLFSSSEAAQYVAHDRIVMTTGEAMEVEEPAEDIDGSWLSIKFPLMDESGQPYALAGISTDITSRKRAEAAAREARDEAERANHAKSEFLSRMSHELRTPLNAILGFGQLLEMEPLSDASRGSVDRILKAGRHLLQLINEVLDITRIEADAQYISLAPVHACDPLQEALELVRPLARERGIDISTDMHGGLHRYVQADFQRLKQVLLNLLTNAIKYNRDEGIVRVSFAEHGESLRYLVTDTGPGIEAKDQSRVFLPFERLTADRTETEGSGLGLALSNSLTEAMKGRLGIQHSARGEGSTFYVELECVERPSRAHVQPAVRPVRPEAWELGDVTVLYVEDNLSNFELVQQILARAHIAELIPAMQGNLAVELAAQHAPDVILLDLDLPDISGAEVLRRLKADARTNTMPVIILSADATPEQVVALECQGVAAYLTKPLDVSRFLDTVKGALRPPMSQ